MKSGSTLVRTEKSKGLSGLELWLRVTNYRFSLGVGLILALALLPPCEARLSAQSPTGSVVGTVEDAQGLPIEEADVTLTNLGTNYNYTSATSSNDASQFQSIDYGLF